MRTAIDSSVLLAIFNGEKTAHRWMSILINARREGQLVICDVVCAELAPAFGTQSELWDALDRLGIVYEPLSPEAAWRAGVSFRAYRESGGPREHIIPDFLIAAHAEVQADRLAAIDRGYLRRYFASLTVLAP